jgi:hypothetical protein
LLTFKAFNGMGVYKIGPGVEPDSSATIPGDVNGDGHVSSVDVTALYNYLLDGNDTDLVNGDQDGDGHISSVDITVVYNIMLGN